MKVITVDNYDREGPNAVVEEVVAGPGLSREEARQIADAKNAVSENGSVFYTVVLDDYELQPAWEP